MKHLFLLSALWIALSAYGQEKGLAERTFKFGKVERSEFDTKVSGPDSAANGVKLFDVGKGWFEVSPKTGNFVYVFERHMRYKVLTKSGYDLADFDVNLYHSGNGPEEVLDFMDAATYNLENDKIVVSKLARDARFSEKHDKNWTVKKFTLPNVKEGSIVEYRYKIKSDYLFNLRDWYFQGSLPTLYSEFDVRIPEYFKYKLAGKGYIQLNPLKRESISESYYIPSTSTSSAGNITANALEMKWNVANVPAIKNEKFITTLEDYISKVEFELTATHYPGSIYKDLTSNWEKIVEDLLEDENFGKFITKNSYSKSILPAILKGEKNPELQMQLIYDYVKRTVKWDDKYRRYTGETSIKAVLEKKSGSSADINFSLLNLLTTAGFNASPVLVSTRENGTHPGYPMLSKFNNVIVQVEIDSVVHLLDATDKFLCSDVIAYENLCHQGFKIDTKAKNGAWISLEQTKPSRNNAFYNLVLTEDNKLTGNLYLSYTNYAAVNHRNRYASATNEAEYLKNYKKDKPGLEIKNYKIENLDNLGEALTETMDVTIEDNVEEAGNLVILTPLLYERTTENPFKMDERNFPVDFAYPLEENFRVNIEFPKSYQLDKLPKNGKIKLPNDEASFTFLFATEENKVSISSKISVGKSVFTAEEYHSLKELFKNIVEKQAQQIVFKKI
ncbi:DUF3857 domain-containing protein [Pedobacter sp. MC2016-14]|uniref:DUF3858 domain-containing protein n=1 Tax=Pedobacter sp. MC2016-14 TaxID=2897327 RepID=UPI001E2EC0B3|nr:DUF3858 domain-containing protein [Pedobacter sp. MC2016-14]MCD0487385.1 DUF3857 domain-containing protein [Pedobacter sp. MC2016-14]